MEEEGKGEVGRREGGGGRKVGLRRQRSSVRELFDNISYEWFILLFRKMFLPEFFPDYYPTALGLFKKLHESALHFFFMIYFSSLPNSSKGIAVFKLHACLQTHFSILTVVNVHFIIRFTLRHATYVMAWERSRSRIFAKKPFDAAPHK